MQRQAVLHAVRTTSRRFNPARLNLRPFAGWLKEHAAIQLQERFQCMVNVWSRHI